MRKEPVCSCQDLYDKPSDRTDDKDMVTRTIAKRGSVACGTTAEQQIGGRIIRVKLTSTPGCGDRGSMVLCPGWMVLRSSRSR